MIDTIVISIPFGQFTIHKPELFTPNASWVLRAYSGRKGTISKYNPTAREQKAGYKPRLTLMNQAGMRSFHPVLRIEASLPKLLFGNNFQELRYKDFAAVVDKLVLSLFEMGGRSE